MKIFLSAGHGGKDPGSVSGKVKEADVVWDILGKTYTNFLRTSMSDVDLIPLSEGMSLEAKVNYINHHTVNKDEDVCLEIHLNSFWSRFANGTETWYGHKPTAEIVQKELVAELGLKNRGIKKGHHLYFNKATKPLSSLLELGFISNANDLRVVQEKGYLAVARAILMLGGASALHKSKVESPRIEFASSTAKKIKVHIDWIQQHATDVEELL